MSRWPVGEAEIQAAIDKRDLALAPPNPDHALRLLAEAQSHVQSAKLITDIDPVAAYQIAYSGLRKACTALLAYQGLRATHDGGHVIVFDAVEAQFNGPRGHRAFSNLQRFRQMRNSAEYPEAGVAPAVIEDVEDCIERTEQVLEASRKLLESGQLSEFS